MARLPKQQYWRTALAVLLCAAVLLQSPGVVFARIKYSDFAKCKPDGLMLQKSQSDKLEKTLEQDVTDIALAHKFARSYAQYIASYNALDVHCRPLLDAKYHSDGLWAIGLSETEISDVIVEEYASRAVRLQLQKLAGVSVEENQGSGLYYRALDQLIVNRELLANDEAPLKALIDKQVYTYVYGPNSAVDTKSPDFDIKDYKTSFYNIKKATMWSSGREYDTKIAELQKLVIALGVVSGAVGRAVDPGVPIGALFTSPDTFIPSMDLPYNDGIALAFKTSALKEIGNYYTNYKLNKSDDALNAESMMILYAALDLEKTDWTPTGHGASSFKFGVPELADGLYAALIEQYPKQWGAAQARAIAQTKNVWFYSLPVAGVFLAGGIAAFSGFWATVGLIAIEGADHALGGGETFQNGISNIVMAMSKGDRDAGTLAGSDARILWDWGFKGGAMGIVAIRGSAFAGSLKTFAQTRMRQFAQRGWFGPRGRAGRMAYRSRAGQIVLPTQRAGSLSEKLAATKGVPPPIPAPVVDVFQAATGRALTATVIKQTSEQLDNLFYQTAVRFHAFSRASREYAAGLNAVKIFDHPTVMMVEDDFINIVRDKGVIRPVSELKHLSSDLAKAAEKYAALGQSDRVFAGRTIPWEKEFGTKIGGGIGVVMKKEVAQGPETIVNYVNSKSPSGWFAKPSAEQAKQGMLRVPSEHGDFVKLAISPKPVPHWKIHTMPSEDARVDFTAQVFANIFKWAGERGMSTKTAKEMAKAVSQWSAVVGKRAETEVFPETLLNGSKSLDDVYAYLLPETTLNRLKGLLVTADQETKKVISKILDKGVPYMREKNGVVNPDRYGKITEALGELLDSASNTIQ